MKKLSLYAVAILFTAFSFAQDKGQWSFGAGGDFTAPDANANIGYFAMDGLMLSFDFNMTFDYDDEVTHDMADGTTHTHTEEVEGGMSWGAAVRYYPKGNFFFEGGMRTGDDHGDHDHGDDHGDEDPDLYIGAGVSLELAWDGKLWLEPMIKLNMPGAEIGPESQNTLGLAWAFRYTF